MEMRTAGHRGPLATQCLREAVKRASPSTFKGHQCQWCRTEGCRPTVAVPLPYSSNKISDFSELSRRAAATLSIMEAGATIFGQHHHYARTWFRSTMNVDKPTDTVSLVRIRVNIRSTIPISATSAGTKLPRCAMNTNKPT